ncbi:hypothetical protein M758_2G059300 [Ceratodon purpureus]|nr:hypothetical protein M758_2G059300 [Ceratodon purpureus]
MWWVKFASVAFRRYEVEWLRVVSLRFWLWGRIFEPVFGCFGEWRVTLEHSGFWFVSLGLMERLHWGGCRNGIWAPGGFGRSKLRGDSSAVGNHGCLVLVGVRE